MNFLLKIRPYAHNLILIIKSARMHLLKLDWLSTSEASRWVLQTVQFSTQPTLNLTPSSITPGAQMMSSKLNSIPALIRNPFKTTKNVQSL